MKFSEQYGEKERNEQGKKKVFVVCLDLIYTLFIPYLYLIYMVIWEKWRTEKRLKDKKIKR